MKQDRHHRGADDQPGIASADQGVVILDGPDGVALTMTPDAADGTGRSLLAAAEAARAQRPKDG